MSSFEFNLPPCPCPSGTSTFPQVFGIARPNTLAMADGLNVDIYSSVMVGVFDAEVLKYKNLCNIYTKIITFIELTLQLTHIPNINMYSQFAPS